MTRIRFPRTGSPSRRRTALLCFTAFAAAACVGSTPPASNSSAGGTNADAAGSSGTRSSAGASPGVAGADVGAGGTVNASAGSSPAAGAHALGGAAGHTPFDWVGVIGTGQSLSVGQEGFAVSLTQPYGNLKLQDDGPDPKYPITEVATAKWSAVPLTEPIRKAVPGEPDGPYPNNIWHYQDAYGESPHSGIGNMLSFIWKQRNNEDYVSAHTVVGYGGMSITVLAKGTPSYAAALNEARVFRRLAEAAGKNYGVGAVVLTHGETDAMNANYGPAVWQLVQDYEADLKQTTGQSSAIPMIASQQSSYAGPGNSAVQLWRTSADHPDKLICAGPKYQYGPYGLHMSGPSYQRLGEKYAEIIDVVVNQKLPWRPVGPKSASRTGAVITIEFDVPSPPLTWDTHLAMPHTTLHSAWSKGRGFEVSDSAGKELEIASIDIKSSTVLVLTLAQAPAAGALTLAYAVTQDTSDGFQGGTDLGPHGQLRDSDDLVGVDGEQIMVNVKQGSADIQADAGGFTRRAPRDQVTGPGLPVDTAALKLNGDSLTLSAPWPGQSGKAQLTFHHDLHNYCVHFSMPVP